MIDKKIMVYVPKFTKQQAAYQYVSRMLLAAFCTDNSGDNIVFSPYSVLTLLAIVAFSSKSQTQEEIMQALGLKNMVALLDALNDLTAMLEKTEEVETANAVCLKEAFAKWITPGYPKKLTDKLCGKVFASGHIMKAVNQWVTEKTHGMITKIIDDDNKLDIALINAIYFDAKWQHPYWEENIEEDVFKNADGSESEVTYLYSDENDYIEGKTFVGFVRPYQRDFSFMALLPKKGGRKALSSILKSVDFSETYRSKIVREVNVAIPEFETTFHCDLTDKLKDMGMTTMFTDKADFSPMVTKPAKVDAVVHKAKIIVNRHGTKAAAVTIGEVEVGCLPDFDRKTVYLNRPFIYAIMHDETALPIFVGVMNQIK